ncbi:zinc finger, RING-type domain-containing protein [Endozoicomonas sp. ONNA1]|uniref:RING finger protein n=2 Tax=unclassified Endozoicomonas TaxID=2644528 RepID=UPI0021490CDC|nr:zinc finger, RING-type domain-containing protein [Endozoicomonas sp. ONNA1]
MDPQKATGLKSGNHPLLQVSSDYPFIITGSEPVADPHTLCQPIDTPENRTWQCSGLESITSVALDTGEPLYLKTDPHQSIVLHYNHGSELLFPEYNLSDYRTFFKKQQAERERILKITIKKMPTNRLKIKIAGEVIDDDSSRRMHIAKTEGISVREQKDIEEEYKRRREDAHTQSDRSVMEQLHLIDTDLCLATTMEACREVLSKIVTSVTTRSGTTYANTSPPSQKKTQGAPKGRKRKRSGEGRSVIAEADSTTQDPEPPAKIQKLQQVGSEPELTKDDPQQLLNHYLEGFHIMHTPKDNFCWLHAIHLSGGRSVSSLIQILKVMINHSLNDDQQEPDTELSDFLSGWVTAKGLEKVQLVRQQLLENKWPDFDILLPLLSYLFKKTFVVVNLQASGLTQDQVFTYATSGDVEVHVVSQASAINTSEETVYLGLLLRDNHFVGIRPDTRNDDLSHRCPVCLDKFTKSSVVKITSCFHYLCGACFKKFNKPQTSECPECGTKLEITIDLPRWKCPVCRKQQEFIEPEDHQ